MEQATVEEQKETVDYDTSHFKSVRRGFDRDVFVGEFIGFGPEDFDWRLTEISEWDREMSCSLVGDLKPHVVSQLEMLASDGWKRGEMYRDEDGMFHNMPHPWLRLEETWHFKGCRTESQKKKRKHLAFIALEVRREEAMGEPTNAAKINACERFNKEVLDIVETRRREYIETWVKAIAEGSQRDSWVLDHDGDDPHADKVKEYREAAEREKRLSETVRELRAQLSELRTAQHKRYNALAQQRMIDDGWTDNDKLPLPTEVVTFASEKLLTGKRRNDPFHD